MGHTIVIGAGQAGAACAIKLRNSGYKGEISLIGAEKAPPYQRPPLSKGYLLGETELERLFLRPEAFYGEQGIDLRIGQAASALNTTAKTVKLGEEKLTYSDLVLTTGSSPNRLPATIGGNLTGVHVIRDLADVDGMSARFVKGARVLIVGGGYIGLEAAAVAAKLGLHVTLVEMADRILQRVAAPKTSDFFRSLHQRHGVVVCEGVGLKSLMGDKDVSSAILEDETVLEVDFVIVGVGIRPETELAKAAGIQIKNGVKVNTQGQTSAAHVWAAGDCTSFPYRGERIRLESVPNAIDQAECVAENIMGAGKNYVARPWFWSDQYDVKLQIAGLNTGYDQVVERPGKKDAVSFWYYKSGQLLAVDAMNDPRSYMVGKQLIEGFKSPEPAMVANAESDLKELLRRNG